jgi:hypothetical protein
MSRALLPGLPEQSAREPDLGVTRGGKRSFLPAATFGREAGPGTTSEDAERGRRSAQHRPTARHSDCPRATDHGGQERQPPGPFEHPWVTDPRRRRLATDVSRGHPEAMEADIGLGRPGHDHRASSVGTRRASIRRGAARGAGTPIPGGTSPRLGVPTHPSTRGGNVRTGTRSGRGTRETRPWRRGTRPRRPRSALADGSRGRSASRQPVTSATSVTVGLTAVVAALPLSAWSG